MLGEYLISLFGFVALGFVLYRLLEAKDGQ